MRDIYDESDAIDRYIDNNGDTEFEEYALNNGLSEHDVAEHIYDEMDDVDRFGKLGETSYRFSEFQYKGIDYRIKTKVRN